MTYKQFKIEWNRIMVNGKIVGYLGIENYLKIIKRWQLFDINHQSVWVPLFSTTFRNDSDVNEINI